jgi:hypothetical protein
MLKEIQITMGMGVYLYSVGDLFKLITITEINKRFDKDLQKYTYQLRNDEQLLAIIISDSVVEIYV